MVTRETIEEFFEEQFHDTSKFFLYKDKQLLKNGQYREYAREQISKANKIFWSVAWSLFFFSFYGATRLIEYRSDPNWFDLSLGLVALIALFVSLLFSAKQYYTIKSSMSFFIKLLDKQDNQTAP